MTAAVRAALGPVGVASEPPEARGLARDDVRLLVARPAGVTHAAFRDLATFLEPGDLVVVNTSGTLAAAVDGQRAGRGVTVHLSTALPDGSWAAELRPGRRANGPLRDVVAGDTVLLPHGRLQVLAPYPEPDAAPAETRLWRCLLVVPGPVPAYLARHGRPIAYAYVPDDWPLASYQTVFARDPGSAEMPSAGRPFTDRLVTDLATAGVPVTAVTLHTGVSSLEKGETPLPEPFRVPATTAALVNHTRAAGGRVVAVGTTVTRALETCAEPDGTVHPDDGWTGLVLGPDRPARVVTGLVTGWHDEGASHLELLSAVAGDALVAAAYAEARAEGYLWHELGDAALLLP
jgi:S-adenosylmethionine:tRNA ribosyltransferase-isomerase